MLGPILEGIAHCTHQLVICIAVALINGLDKAENDGPCSTQGVSAAASQGKLHQ